MLVTFLLSGLWHGANWTFVIWGMLHGLGLVVEKFCHRNITSFPSMPNFVRIIIIFVFCNIAWIVFRANNIGDFVFILQGIVNGMNDPSTFLHSNIGLNKSILIKIGISLFILAMYDYMSTRHDVLQWVADRNFITRWCIYIGIIFYTILNMPLKPSSFIYFQF